MIKYTRFNPERGSISVSIKGLNQGYIPWVFLHRNVILNRPGWGTLTIL